MIFIKVLAPENHKNLQFTLIKIKSKGSNDTAVTEHGKLKENERFLIWELSSLLKLD